MIDLTKPLQTRDGSPVEIVATKGRGEFPVVGYIDKEDQPSTWDIHGSYHGSRGINSPRDLINVPEPRGVWVNINQDQDAPERLRGGVYSTRFRADSFAIPDRIALLHITHDATGWHIEEVK